MGNRQNGVEVLALSILEERSKTWMGIGSILSGALLISLLCVGWWQNCEDSKRLLEGEGTQSGQSDFSRLQESSELPGMLEISPEHQRRSELHVSEFWGDEVLDLEAITDELARLSEQDLTGALEAAGLSEEARQMVRIHMKDYGVIRDAFWRNSDDPEMISTALWVNQREDDVQLAATKDDLLDRWLHADPGNLVPAVWIAGKMLYSKKAPAEVLAFITREIEDRSRVDFYESDSTSRMKSALSELGYSRDVASLLLVGTDARNRTYLPGVPPFSEFFVKTQLEMVFDGEFEQAKEVNRLALQMAAPMIRYRGSSEINVRSAGWQLASAAFESLGNFEGNEEISRWADEMETRYRKAWLPEYEEFNESLRAFYKSDYQYHVDDQIRYLEIWDKRGEFAAHRWMIELE